MKDKEETNRESEKGSRVREGRSSLTFINHSVYVDVCDMSSYNCGAGFPQPSSSACFVLSQHLSHANKEG